MKSSEHWAKVANDRMADIHRASNPYIRDIHRAYDKALEDIEEDIKKTFRKFAKDGKLTSAEAQKLLTAGESKEVLNDLRAIIKGVKDKDVKRALLNRINAPAYAARLTRLNALREKIFVRCKELGAKEIERSSSSYLNSLSESYYRTIFDLQRQVGYAFDFSILSTEVIDQILMRKFKGARFSDRVWHNTDVLAGKLQEVLTSGIMSGRSYQQMAREMEQYANITNELKQCTKFGKYASMRLVRTEATYFSIQAKLKVFREAGVTHYIFRATLDLKTSEICQEHDGIKYRVSNATPGKNCPPMHPHCRSQINRAYDEPMDGIKRAVDPKTGKRILVSTDMNYKEWYQKCVIDKYGKDQAKIMKREARSKKK